MDTLFPEIPENATEPTEQERNEIASQLVAIWDNPPEVVHHWEKDGKVVKEDKVGATPIMTKIAHYSRGWRLRQALNNSTISAERKAALGRVKFKLEAVDSELFDERDEIVRKIEETMSKGILPKNKAELDGIIAENIIPVSKFTQKFIDSRVGTVDAVFADFADLYKDLNPIGEPEPI